MKLRLAAIITKIGPTPPAARRLLLLLFAGATLGGFAAAPRAVPTFNCVGVYWRSELGAADNPCLVRYRPAGTVDWREALPLWFDPNEHAGAPEHSFEYRGSIVGLQAGTDYEIEFRLERTGTVERLAVRTWSDQFPVARTVTVGQEDPRPLVITEGGSPERGYVVYTPAPGMVLDGEGKADANIVVQASHVILRGFVLRNAARHGIILGDVTDVVIERCDISGWGRTGDEGFGLNLDSAVYSESRVLERIVIQDSQLHHPRSNANSWTESRHHEGKTTKHPIGPQGISFVRAKGHFVIRRNRIFSDPGHKFNDGMGEVHNMTFAGFPRCDTDIHDNYVQGAYDDGIEVEGANLNVRVWGNRIDDVYGAIGAAITSLGPIYIWRNVLESSRKGPGTDADANRGAYLIKLGNENEAVTKGRIYIFHNTMLQPPPRPGFSETSGGSVGYIVTATTKRQSHIMTRNNILFIRDANRLAVNDPSRDPTNDFDFDLYIGGVVAREGTQRHGIQGRPEFDPAGGAGRHPLRPGSPGFDAGMRLPNFNDGFHGAAPDMGAFEAEPRESP